MMGSGRRLHHMPDTNYYDEADQYRPLESLDDCTTNDAMGKDAEVRADSPVENVEANTTAWKHFGNHDSYDYVRNEDVDSPIHRSVSNITATSISSLPSSTPPSECETQYTPTKHPRSSLLSTSGKKTSMNTYPIDHLSPHRTFRARSPKKSANVRASPRPRTRDRQEEVDTSVFPLVLLHVTILPIALPWSRETVSQVLPTRLMDNLALLKSRMSNTVLQRGILIPHPQEDFEALEERVLESLELCASTTGLCIDRPTMVTPNEDQQGEVYQEEQDDCCQTCGDTNCFSQGLDRRWQVRVYAANGMLRAGAWEAAWSEMERVDVEILPYMPYRLRRKLDEVQAEADRELTEIRQAVREPTVARSDTQHTSIPTHPRDTGLPYQVMKSKSAAEPHGVPSQSSAAQSPVEALRTPLTTSQINSQEPLPAVYKAKDIPLGVLLSNYIYLLAQDRRNIAIIFLILAVVAATAQGMSAQQPVPEVALARADGLLLPSDATVVNSSWNLEESVRAANIVLHDMSEQVPDLAYDEVTGVVLSESNTELQAETGCTDKDSDISDGHSYCRAQNPLLDTVCWRT